MELSVIKSQVELELANQENVAILVATTFKGLTQDTMKRAMIEGMMRGFNFKDFLEKNIYAIPFSGGYSLVTSIDHARKIGMRSGVCGKSAPSFEEKDGKVISCTVTVKRKINEYVGDFTATVYFSEYNTGKNTWATKPRTMIAKVAEMHALRMACPEEMAQMYSEEEMEKEVTRTVLDVEALETKIRAVADIEELKRVWSALPAEAKTELTAVKDEVKVKLTPPPIDFEVTDEDIARSIAESSPITV